MKKVLLVFFTIGFSFLLFSQNLKKHHKMVQKSKEKGTVKISLDTVFFKGDPILLESKVNMGLVSAKTYSDFSGTSKMVVQKYGVNPMYGIQFFPKFEGVDKDIVVISKSYEDFIHVLLREGVFSEKGELMETELENFSIKYEYVEPEVSYSSSTSSSSSDWSSSTTSTSSSSISEPEEDPCPYVSPSLYNGYSETLYYKIVEADENVKYASGTTSTIGSNTRTSISGDECDKVCIVTGSGDEIACTALESGTIEINSSGTGFR